MAAPLPYDLILMDYEIRKMDGFTATREIRDREGRSSHQTPIVALTAGAMIDDRDRCLETGMDGYLTKPGRADHLRAVAEQSLPI